MTRLPPTRLSDDLATLFGAGALGRLSDAGHGCILPPDAGSGGLCTGDPAARDALVWVLNKPGMRDVAEYGDEFARAAALLVRHHGDDPEAVRIGLGLDNVFSQHRDELLSGFYASAKGQEAKGLARLALAQYLEGQAKYTTHYRATQGRQKMRYIGVIGDDGKPFDKEVEQSDEEYAYVVQLRLREPEAMSALAERLYKEVIAEYSDVVHRTLMHRELEALLQTREPRWNGKPLTPQELGKLKELIAKKWTLGAAASRGSTPCKTWSRARPRRRSPASISMGSRSAWPTTGARSWCWSSGALGAGPACARFRMNALAAQHKDKPFAVLGVNCDEDKQAAQKAIKDERMAWPNWHDGAPGEGPIAKRYHIRAYPSVFVIDGKGIIRQRQAQGDGLDTAVDALLTEMESNRGGAEGGE